MIQLPQLAPDRDPRRTDPAGHEHRHDRAGPSDDPAGSPRFREELRATVSGEVRFGRHDRLLYATDASIYQVEPLGVVVPSSPEDAVRAVRVCARHGVAMLPRGGGTSLAGQGVNRAVVLDLSAGCASIGPMDASARWVEAGAGVTIDELNGTVLAGAPAERLHFAPDPSTTRQATVAGCIGNNAAGMHSILYGRTSENVLAVDACLSTGERVRLDEGAAARDPVAARLTSAVVEIVRRNRAAIRARFPRTLRRSAGYQLDVILGQVEAAERDGVDPASRVNLAPLLCGSEGTLAVTLGARLALRPLPRSTGLAVIAFDDMDRAIGAVAPMLELGPAAVELLDDLIIGAARQNVQQRRNVERLPAPEGADVRAVLYVELFGEAEGEGFGAAFAEIRRRFGEAWVATFTDASAMSDAWALRRAGEPLLHAIDAQRKPLGFIEDNAVPPERLGEFVRELRSIVSSHGTVASFYAHASVGVLHVRPLLDLRVASDREAMHDIAARAAALAKRLGGVMSGEHGDGRSRGPFLADYFGPELMGAFREVKAAFDPGGLLNPGNIVSPGGVASISENVRLAPGEGASARRVSVPPVGTYYTYDDQHGFDGAVEMCNGAGVCRKRSGGTMCPSYMATQDERHSTRGRGNALRLALTGQSLPDGASGPWRDPETMATLDLCLSCKACKAECPSNVDIARLKSEYLAQGHRERASRGEGVLGTGTDLRTFVFGHVHTLNRLASVAPGLTNAVNGWRPTRAMLGRLLGLHPGRSLPRFARPLVRAGVRRTGPSGDGPRVVLYVDTFTNHGEPAIGRAAVAVLTALGYRVELFAGSDAGRAMMSVGMLEQAIDAAGRELGRLRPFVDAPDAPPILFLEPSVLSAVDDDWPLLRIDDPAGVRERLRSRATLVERFVADGWASHPGSARVAPRSIGPIVVHEHCHQRALWGAGTSAGLLRRLAADPGEVRLLDSGCCGMAGSFGYTRGRFDLSNAIGEGRLFPAVRAGVSSGAWIAAGGTSCRHQVLDATGVHARHPIELAAMMLGVGPG